MRGRLSHKHPPFALVAPALVFAAVIFLGAFAWMLWLSFTDYSFAAANQIGRWIGVANYERALSADPVFIWSLIRSLVFTGLCVSAEIVIAVVLTELLYRNPPIRRYLIPVLALPALLPSVGTALYWRILLQGEFGLLSYLLSSAGIESARAILSNSRTILVTLAVVDVWQWAPFATLLLFAVRVVLPRSHVEAATLDGASDFQAFRDVTLPMLRPAIVVIAIVRASDVFKEFDKVFILTGGGPGTASELVSLHLWRVAFKYWDFGYAAALSIVVYVVMYGGAAWGARWTKQRGLA